MSDLDNIDSVKYFITIILIILSTVLANDHYEVSLVNFLAMHSLISTTNDSNGGEVSLLRRYLILAVYDFLTVCNYG
jgi:hypothetical protein